MSSVAMSAVGLDQSETCHHNKYLLMSDDCYCNVESLRVYGELTTVGEQIC